MRKKVIRLWWGWNPTKIEAYLEKMASEGWKLIDTSLGFVFFVFEKTTPEKIRYVFDFQSSIQKEYLTIIEDSGWSLVNQLSGWFLWKQPYSEKRPELITDIQSLVDRNNRLLLFLVATGCIQLPLTLGILFRFGNTSQLFGTFPFMMLFSLCVFVTVLTFLSLMILFYTTKKLKSQGRR